ncbi:hypothetical protein ACJX0J_023931, partial [Zea mays]
SIHGSVISTFFLQICFVAGDSKISLSDDLGIALLMRSGILASILAHSKAKAVAFELGMQHSCRKYNLSSTVNINLGDAINWSGRK